MNVLYVHYLEEIGGGEKYLINVINNLPSDINVYLLTPNSDTELEKMINKSVTKVSIKYRRNWGAFPAFSLPLLIKISQIIRKHNIDVIHFGDHYLMPTMLMIRYIYNLNIVFTSHGAWDTHFYVNRLLLRLLNPYVLAFTYVNYFRLTGLVDNIKLLPMIVQDPNINRPQNVGKLIKIGVIGRFSPVKNHHLAIKVFGELDQTKFEMHFYGDQTLNIKEETSEYRESVLNSIKSNDNIIHHGIVRDQDEIYNNIDILMQPSLTEAASLVTVESQKYGLPLVCSLTEASAFSVVNGYNGYICLNFNDYVRSINKIVKNYSEFSKNSIKNAEKFSTKKYIKNLIIVYNVANNYLKG